MGPDQVVAYANKILLAYVDLIHRALGGAYPIVQDMLSDAMMRLLTGGLMSPEQIADLGQDMCEKAERENRHQNEYYFNLRLHMANARLLMGDKDATKLQRGYQGPQNSGGREQNDGQIARERGCNVRGHRVPYEVYRVDTRLTENKDPIL
ncbi:hypothetical protein INS49_003551 [Diaporthe citri]|uniref:uncharacterized protein n=1 Tax=Diaporthe citri TaxID=83186 RepID=UPI001C80804A|nr:uncharacterized protein INS49_003551 [Diaporthe citri]KAG6355589.1 hypothetical protein INS49_003551 [Diaporthe citri]